MHFEVGRIVPFVRITRLTVVLLKENTGGKSDPLNPVSPYKRKDCVGEHSTWQVCFSLFFQSPILTSRTCLSGEGESCRGFPEFCFNPGFGKLSTLNLLQSLGVFPISSAMSVRHSEPTFFHGRITYTYFLMTSRLTYLNLQM